MQEVSIITSRLEKSGIAYCIAGGLASIAYGRPRLTLDADIVIVLRPQHLAALSSAFPADDFYLPPEEVLLAEIQRESRGHFNILHQHSALRADCYISGEDELSRWVIRNRRRLQGPWGECWFASPEAVILYKLLFYREGASSKHLDDIQGIIEADSVENLPELMDWIQKLDLEKQWEAIFP